MLIDTHSHLNFNAYKEDAEEVIKRSLENDIWMINVGSQYETSKRAIELAEKYNQGVYASVGFHPIHLGKEFFKVKMDSEETNNDKEKDFDIESYRELAKSSKVKAIGEIGLDYYYRPKSKTKTSLFKEKQKEIFLKQLDLAKELNLPVVFHCRMAHEDLIATLKQRNDKGVIHCFTGNLDQAKEYVKMGFYIGFNGIIFKLDLNDIIKKIPLEKILIETDCPYLTPPEAKTERNEPIFMKYVAKKIAELKEIDYEKVAQVTTENARSLFKI